MDFVTSWSCFGAEGIRGAWLPRSDRRPVERTTAVSSRAPDILVDLLGYTQGARPSLHVHGSVSQHSTVPAAPIILTSLGFWGTMGNAHIHYTVSDARTLPVERACGRRAFARRWMTESLLLLPRAHQLAGAYERPGSAPRESEIVGGDPCAPPSVDRASDARVILASFATFHKWSPVALATWARILRRLRARGVNAQLWLRSAAERPVGPSGSSALGDQEHRVLAVLRSAGLGDDAVRFCPRLPSPEAYFRRLRAVDLLLDTPGYGAHTTLVDALAQSTPVLTTVADTPPVRSRKTRPGF